jgi:hypothetical protein
MLPFLLSIPFNIPQIPRPLPVNKCPVSNKVYFTK